VASRPDPPDLEGFIEDSFFLDRLPPGSRERLIRYYEPFRERIEYAMQESFEPETMSWRDWRNSYWDYLPPAPLEELKMPDDEIRALERAAATDPSALTRLTSVRIRRCEGVLWVWVHVPSVRIDIDGSLARHGVPPELAPEVAGPEGPEGSVEITIHDYMTGGEVPLSGGPGRAAPKRAWALACLDISSGVFALTTLPKPRVRDVAGPMLLDLLTGRFITGLSLTTGVRAVPREGDPTA